MDKKTQEIERKFLHDLANPLTVAKILVKRVATDFNSTDPEVFAKQRERLEKVLHALDQMESLHAEHKANIHKKAG